VGKLQPILSRLPKEFEKQALSKVRDKEKQRLDFVREVSQRVDDAERGGFDIDKVSDADLTPPELPPSPFHWRHIGKVFTHPELLPPGAEVKALDGDSWSLQLPGMQVPIRVTPSPQLFDEHFTSMQLLWYGAAVLDSLEYADLRAR
jgi:hypothetical protein